jgi:hypothetical protein
MQMIDVMKRLADLDTANPSRPEHKVSGNQNITALSESAQVDECGMMPEMGDMGRPSTPASINMTAGSGDELGELIKAIATLAGQARPAEMEPLSAMPAMGVASNDGMDMRAMIDKLNPMDDEGDEELKKVDEYDNTPADPTDTNEFDAEEFAHHENPPGAASGRGNMNNPRAVPTMEEIEQNLFSDYKKFISEADVAEGGVGDMIINAIEAVRMAKPGLKQQDFLDELYMYIENRNGQRAAEMMSNAGQDEYDEWYDNYLDTAEEGVAEGGVSMPGGQYLSIPADQTKLSIGQQMARDGITYSPDKEDELIGLISQYMKKAGMSSKQIRYLLNYDEDYISDQLSDLPKKGTEEGIEDRLKDLDPKNPVNIPAYQRKAASGDSASAARNTKESANESMTDILKLSGLK